MNENVCVGSEDKDAIINNLREEVCKLNEMCERMKQRYYEADSELRSTKEELRTLKDKMEAIRSEKASLDILCAERDGMIQAYEYALDAIAGRNNKC